MLNPLIGLHAAIGELGVISFLWTFIELITPTPKRIQRAKIAAFIGVILLIISWIIAGYYYVNVYGKKVKPIIKGGPSPWAHSIGMETKEHIFLFLPFLAILACSIIFKYQNQLIKNKELNKSLLILLGLIILLGFSIAGLGYIISSSAREALEVIKL